MMLVRRSPERESLARRDLGSAFSDLFDRFFDGDIFSTELAKTGWNPKIDVYEKGGNVVIQADVPGMDEKDLNVELENNIISISGMKKEEHEKKDKNYHQIERSYGSFCRSVQLPDGIQPEKVNAEYKKGVLTVTVPKAKEASAKKIEVKVS